MLNCLAVGLGGFLGSVLRYLLSLVPLDRTGSFPMNTLCTNVLGAFAIGLLAAALSRQSDLLQRLGRSRNIHRVQYVTQVLHNHLGAYAVEVEPLTARQYRRGQFLRLCRGQYEHRVCGRLLQRL